LNQFTNLANKLSNLANETTPQQYIIGNGIVATQEPMSATSRVLTNRRDSTDSRASSSSAKIVQNTSVKALHRRKINFEYEENGSLRENQQKIHADNLDTNSVEVEIVEMDHSMKTASSISSGSSGIGISDNFNNSNSKRLKRNSYRSLQKSKKSIKTIEATLRNSCSIEKWLNDFGKLLPDEKHLKSSHLTSKFNSKMSSNENLALNSDAKNKSAKRAKSFCDYDNDGNSQGESMNNTQRLFIKKKKQKKNLKSKISLDENEEISMNNNNQKFSNQQNNRVNVKDDDDDDEEEEEEVKCNLEIENHKMANGDQLEYDDDDCDEQADELKKLLLEIHREHDMEKLSTSSDANFKNILQQLIESSSKSNQSSHILHGLVNHRYEKLNQI
jgi:hypothetical protein